MTNHRTAKADAQELVEAIRSHPFASVAGNGEVLALAALFRCAHLLDFLAVRVDDDDDPLMTLGLRDVLETSINGMVSLAQPEEFRRFVRKDLDGRRSIVRALEAEEGLDSFLADHAELVDGVPGLWTFAQRVDLVTDHLPGVFADSADAGRAKGMYAHLCNFSMHGGAGVLGDYIGGDAQGLTVIPVPESLFRAADVVNLAAGFTHKLFTLAREQLGKP